MKHPLRTYRERFGVTLSDLSARVGCSVATLSRIEHGRRVPSLDLMRRIAEGTNNAITPNDFWKHRGVQ
jgi:Predicted transcriptional regulators